MKALEGGVEIVQIVRKDGIAGLWDYLKDQFQDLKETIMDSIMDIIQSQVIQAGIKWILGLLSPVGAFVKAIMAIIDVVKFFVQRAAQIAELISAFMDSVAAIASGKVGAVTKAIENALAKAIPVLIGLLASILGISGLADKVLGVIRKIRQRITAGITKFWKFVKAKGNGLLSKVSNAFGGKKENKTKEERKKEKPKVQDGRTPAEKQNEFDVDPKPFRVGSDEHTLFFENGHLMMASVVSRLSRQLKNFQTEANKHKVETAIVKASQIEKEYANGKNQSLDEKQKDKQAEKVESMEDSLIVLVQEIMYNTSGNLKPEMTLTYVTFLKNKETESNKGEYERQLKMQEDEINNIIIGDWQKRRAKFIIFGRDTADTQKKRLEALIALMIKYPVDAILALHENRLLKLEDKIFIEKIVKTNLTFEDKSDALEDIAKVVMNSYGKQKLAVLHTLDQIASGIATKYGDKKSIFGDTDINSDIGRQWKNGNIQIIDNATKGVDPNASMKVRLK